MAVGLQLATKNSFVRVQEDINDNLTKLDEAIDFNLLATLGIEYGGILNNTNAKTSGKAYYDTTGKKLYKCIANTNINYADAGYFEALSNNDLLGKLQNLIKTTIITANRFYDTEFESKYSYTFPTPKKQILSIMPYDVSYASSETGTCTDNKTIEISATRFGPNIGQTDQTVKAVIKYID